MGAKVAVGVIWLWSMDLYEVRDFERVGAHFAEDGRYEDVPMPDGGAVGDVSGDHDLEV